MGLFDGIRGSTALGSKRPLHFSTSFKQHRKVVTRDLVLLQKEMKTYFVKEILFLFFVNRIYVVTIQRCNSLPLGPIQIFISFHVYLRAQCFGT